MQEQQVGGWGDARGSSGRVGVGGGSVSTVLLVWMLCLFRDDLLRSLGVKDGTFLNKI